MLHKVYRSNPEADTRYSPAKCVGCTSETIAGTPDPQHVSTSYVERSNLTIRTTNRRFTRLTNGFSKRLMAHRHNLALVMMSYNFCTRHGTLKTTPAIAAGIELNKWGLENVVEMTADYWRRKEDAKFEDAFAKLG